ncbi:MAG: Ribonuclease 3, partial [Candidatus Gottesmanbacteria bacterium GW2011_GWC2_39_8]
NTGVKFKDEDLIRKAFIHRSYLNEAKETMESNERLEFLGDSILSFLVSSYLYKEFPDKPEGELTNLRSAIVKTKTLALISQKLELGKYLYLSRGEEEGGGRNNTSLLADTFEAFIGAIFLDSGIEEPRKILNQFLFPLLGDILENKLYKDAKSSFQEEVQEKTRISPVYKVMKEEGPDHAKKFTVGVYVGDKLYGTGDGRNKQEAEQEAARSALEKYHKV